MIVFKQSFHLKLFLNFFKIDTITLDQDTNWAKIQDPDQNSMYLDPQHWLMVRCGTGTWRLGSGGAASTAGESAHLPAQIIRCWFLKTIPDCGDKTVRIHNPGSWLPVGKIQGCRSGSGKTGEIKNKFLLFKPPYCTSGQFFTTGSGGRLLFMPFWPPGSGTASSMRIQIQQAPRNPDPNIRELLLLTCRMLARVW